MVEESKLIEAEGGGKMADGAGWFVVNAKDAPWYENEKFGLFCRLEPEERFEQLGINLHVIWPGKPACHYHRESTQEDFLVLRGRCKVLISGQERELGPWDFVHCPPETDHVFVGLGDEPCLVLMCGARDKDAKIHYPVEEIATRHDASPPFATDVPKESYSEAPPWGPTERSRAELAGYLGEGAE